MLVAHMEEGAFALVDGIATTKAGLIAEETVIVVE